MKISDIFSRQSIYNSGKAQEYARVDEQSKEQLNQGKPGEDRVSISPLAQQFRQVSQILAEDEAARQNRVQALKEQVASGDYKVSSEEVAKSLVSFANDVAV